MEFKIDFLVLALSALIPLLVGFFWYGKMLFANAWMKSAGLTEESMKGANMGLTFGLTYLFSFFIAMILQMMVIHQYSIMSILADEPGFLEKGTDLNNWLVEFMGKYGNNFRTFKHGVFHGVFIGIMFVTPVIAITGMFERRGFKYIAINAGYYIVSLALMGGVICQFANIIK